MNIFKDNRLAFLIILLAVLLVLLVIWIYDRRIQHLEKAAVALHHHKTCRMLI